MKTSQWQSRIKSTVLAFALLFVAAIVSSPAAQAQDRYPNNDQSRRDGNWNQYPNYGGSAELRQTALNAGYNQGLRQATYDRQNGGQQSRVRFPAPKSGAPLTAARRSGRIVIATGGSGGNTSRPVAHVKNKSKKRQARTRLDRVAPYQKLYFKPNWIFRGPFAWEVI